jgi:shikimate dehydrogenase
MEIYGLIGKKLQHSFSPAYFNQKFTDLKIDAEYRLFEIEDISNLSKIIDNNPGLVGLNVTIPYKKAVIPFLDKIDAVCQELGAVNTLKIQEENGHQILKGFNTDIIGFEKSVMPLIRGRKNFSALILGTGGSSRAVTYILKKLGIDYRFVSRTVRGSRFYRYSDLSSEIILKHHLIINTTPAGMFPNMEEAPAIPYESIGENHILFDLIYNPKETLFLKNGKRNGAKIENGLKMLQLQAEASWEIWKS